LLSFTLVCSLWLAYFHSIEDIFYHVLNGKVGKVSSNNADNNGFLIAALIKII